MRFVSARYSVPVGFCGEHVHLQVKPDRALSSMVGPGEREMVAEHMPVAPGKVSITDERYGAATRRLSGAAPDRPKPLQRRCSAPALSCWSLRCRPYERSALGSASYSPLESWGRFLPEHAAAVSMLDRLLHHAKIIVTDGESYRVREARTRPSKKVSPRNVADRPGGAGFYLASADHNLVADISVISRSRDAYTHRRDEEPQTRVF